jgi:hypothetical protein
MPLPEPSDLKWEIWRLCRHHGLTAGDIVHSRRDDARRQRIGRYLAPKSSSPNPDAVRRQLVKKFIRQVDDFLKTPVGVTYQQSWWWTEWLETGCQPGVARIVPFPEFESHSADNHERWVHDNLVNYHDWLSRQ